MSTQFRCIQCGNFEANEVFSQCKDFYLHNPAVVDYVKCTKCDLIQQSNIPKNISVYYNEYPIHKEKGKIYNLLRQYIMSACYFSLKLRNSEKNIMKSLVDFGCGDGWYLSANRSRGFSLAGFEPHSKFTENLSCRLGIPIFSELKSLFEMHEDKTDVVTMHFVLEHLTNLNEAFETVNRLLKKGGIFYFVIPNIASWETKLFGKKWHNLDPPRHISFPEPKAISELARKWGFTIISEKNKSFPNGIAGSLSVVLAGNFSYPLFIMFMPVGVILSKIFPSGNKGYILQKL